jgi:chromosome segregation ATPase
MTSEDIDAANAAEAET